MNNKLRIGSRESRLAVVQTEILINWLREQYPDMDIEHITMKTTGDKILDRTLDKIGGKGLFVKELDRALLSGEIDLAVHSFKDMPMDTPPELPIVATSQREAPFDVLILPKGVVSLRETGVIGCSSARRRTQLSRIYPECTVMPLRGNVISRLEKLDSGEFDAIVLAEAGINRLGLASRINRRFDISEMIPAAGQGVLAVQARADFDAGLLEGFHDTRAMAEVMAERSFVRTLDGGCSSPVAAYARVQPNPLVELEEEMLLLTGMYVNAQEECSVLAMPGCAARAEELGIKLGERLKAIAG